VRQRGFGYFEIAIIAAILIGLGAGAHWMYVLGSDAKQAEWNQQKLKDVQFALARDQDVSDAIKEGEERRQLAQARADQQEDKLQEAIREARRSGTALAICPVSGPDQGSVAAIRDVAGQPSAPRGGEVPVRDPGGGIRLTWQFVREFDGGWTGSDGEPVSRLTLGDQGPQRPGAPSPYGLVDVSGIAVENATRCSRDRRELGALMRKIEDAAAAWDKRKTP
jgi:hypothetical protein